ncbi:C2H2 type zinc finger domain-containing protein [Hirsutella rhossiliensis]
MTTAARQQQQPQTLLAADTFDPDEVVPRDSPLMQALRPKLEPSPSPSPDIPLAQIRPSSGDAVLVSYLDNGRHPDIARAAGAQALPGVDEDDQGQLHHPRPCSAKDAASVPAARSRALPASSNMAMTTPILQHLAADALQAVSAESSLIPLLREVPDISTSTRQLSISDERHKNISDYSASMQPSGPSVQLKTSAKSPASTLNSASGELPPLQMDSPQSESNGHSLPSIRSTLGDIKHMPAEKEMAPIHGSAPAFARSPPLGRPRLPPISASHVSPPISPSEAYQRSLPSPHSLPASSPYSYYQTNGLGHRPSVELSTSAAGETPSTDHSASTPATSASVADRMSIDGITNPQVGVYICNFSGCNAPPFQTQYLLNSHANVHSSARPHYCPVKGCPRSEGGKGFKRKNEMIRHGLVHDSPGYVCPFCPDREHKYPRPDNLQRHVRVHHIDKDKDDPMLRDVLSQRPDGPSRGRRRRGVPP